MVEGTRPSTAGTSRLPAEKVRRLARRVETGDAVARQTLIEAHLWLVAAIGRRYGHYGIPPVDLFQEGTVGLVQAVDHFDWRKGVPFAAYAALWIKQAMVRAVPQLRYAVRIPVSLLQQLVRLDHATEELAKSLERCPDEVDLEPLLADSALSASELAALPLNPVSFDTPGAGSGDDTAASPADVLADPNATQPESAALAVATDERVRELLSALDDREQAIVTQRLGLFGEVEHSLAGVAAQLGLSRQRVQQIERRALEKLRRRLGATHEGGLARLPDSHRPTPHLGVA